MNHFTHSKVFKFMYISICKNLPLEQKNFHFLSDTSNAVELVLKGEKPSKSNQSKSSNKQASEAYSSNKNAKNSKLNDTNKKSTRDSSKNSNSGSRKNSLTGTNSRDTSKTRESRSPSKKVNKTKQEDNTTNNVANGDIITNGDSAQGLGTVIEGDGENGISHKIGESLQKSFKNFVKLTMKFSQI